MEKPIQFETVDEARDYFMKLSNETFNHVLQRKGLDLMLLESLNLEQLKEKKFLISRLIMSKDFLSDNELYYKNDVNFTLVQERPKFAGFKFHMESKLLEMLDFVNNKIRQIEQGEKVKSIEDLVNSMPDSDVKGTILNEIKDLKQKNEELEELKKLQLESSNGNTKFASDIEFEKHKADLFDKKTETWLKILGKESIASILGGFLLFILTVCIIWMMFIEKEPIKIVETAFLLILGYFFGQSNSKNKSAS